MNNLYWSGVATDVVPFAGQNLTVGFSTNPEDPIGTVLIKGTGSATLMLPNSTASSPTWNVIPGTSPVLEARQDGHFEQTHVLIRAQGTGVSITGGFESTQTVGSGLAIHAPLVNIDFVTNPSTTDPNMLEVSINNDPTQIVSWLNELGHLRAEQRTPVGYDHLLTLIASFANQTGRVLRFERRDGSNNRVETGAVNQDGRIMTSLYPYTLITTIDPGATGKYTIQTGANLSAPGVRREADDLVRMQGRIAVNATGTVSGDVVMTLPTGFHPGQQRWLSVTTTGGIAVPCEILTNGQVVARRTQSGAANLVFEDFVYRT